jgi:hypothetical protein
MIIGGKPMDITVFTSFIPVIFELTILFTAFGMVGMFFTRQRMVHGIKEDILDIRQTDDKLVLAIDNGQDQPMSAQEIRSMIESEGAIEVRENGEAFTPSHSN